MPFRASHSFGRATGIQADVVSGFSDANYYQGADNEGLPRFGTLRFVFKVLSVPTGGQKLIAGRTDGTGVDGGWYIATNIYGIGDLTIIQRISGGSRASISWLITEADIGQTFVLHGTADSSTLLTYINGVRNFTGGTTMGAAPAPARTTDKLTIGRFQHAGGLSCPHIGVISLCGTETSVMTPAEIFTDATTVLSRRSKLFFPALPNESMRYLASDLLSNSSSWHDQSGDNATLTRTGTVTVAAAPDVFQFYSPLNQQWSDLAETIITGVYHDLPSEYASMRMQTDAELLYIGNSVDNANASTLQFCSVGVSVDGGAVTAVASGGGMVDLGTGGVSKTVEIISGPQLYQNSVVNQGVWIDRIAIPANRSLTWLPIATTTRRLVTINDSIFVGFYASVPVTQGPHMLIRAAYPGRVTGLGAGSYSLNGLSSVKYAGITALATQVASLCNGSITNEILIQIGTVDFTGNVYNAANYRIALTSFLTALRARTSAYIWLQTIGLRTDVAANTFGDTIAEWRAAQAGAVTDSGISDATVIDGSTMYASGDLHADGVHLVTAGAANYATALITAMGF